VGHWSRGNIRTVRRLGPGDSAHRCARALAAEAAPTDRNLAVPDSDAGFGHHAVQRIRPQEDPSMPAATNAHDTSATAPERRILLAGTGLSPQVVTETIYALAVAAPEPWIPTEVHLVTTSDGADRARHSLLSADPGWFGRLVADYRLPPIAFPESHIHVLEDDAGRPLADIRTPADNDRAADTLTELVRAFTADDDSALHASIAGGRKTMGYYLGYALSLFGRPQDRLSHVLISDPFESSWNFFYPTPYSRIIETRDNKLADTKEAEVVLAEIPFVPLRHGQPDALLAGKARFLDAVDAARRNLGPRQLVIDYPRRSITAGGRAIPLPPTQLAFIGWMARRLLDGKPPLPCPLEDHPEPAYADEYLTEYRAILGEMGDDERTAGRLKAGMDRAFFTQTKSKLDRQLRNHLGLEREHYAVSGRGSPRLYGLRLPRTQVTFAGTPAGRPED
jgi:CRISPR-associated protein (TIGR02584 family)